MSDEKIKRTPAELYREFGIVISGARRKLSRTSALLPKDLPVRQAERVEWLLAEAESDLRRASERLLILAKELEGYHE